MADRSASIGAGSAGGGGGRAACFRDVGAGSPVVERVLPKGYAYENTDVEEGDEQVCYLLASDTQQLLHLPDHIFEMLGRHAHDEHADRNMATHLVQ